MALIEVTIPGVLADCVGGASRLRIEASDLREALRRLRVDNPLLGLHVFDEQHQPRPHVLIFFNGQSIRWLDSLDVKLSDNDRLDIVQAISGGAATQAFVALGANLGERRENIRRATELLAAGPGVRLMRVSSLIETDAVGGPPGSPRFLNGVAEIESDISPFELLGRILEIERRLGRVRDGKWQPRTIDLDILLFGDQIIAAPELAIPHPLMHQRRFVLEPLMEIAPRVIHPVLHRTPAELLKAL